MRLKIAAAAILLVCSTSSFAALIESEPNNTLATADVFPIPTYVPDGGAAYSGFLGIGDVDYYSVTVQAGDLIGGAVFDYTPGDGTDNDSLLGLFNPLGVLVAVDDDVNDFATPNFLSHLHYIADMTGVWTWAVTGFGDPDFDGDGHNQNFAYLFDFSTDSTIPEPATMGLLIAGLGFLARRRR